MALANTIRSLLGGTALQARDVDYDEGKHPRGPGGKWTESGSGEPVSNSLSFVHTLRTKMAHEAQKEYDEWSQDEEGIDEELGSGGICDRIAERLGGVLAEHGIDSKTTGDGDHAWIIANLREGVYTIDIPAGVYETGGGYNWQKREGVKFDPDHVLIDKLDKPMSADEFENTFADGLRLSDAFEEGLHPRDPHGQFAPVGPHGESQSELVHQIPHRPLIVLGCSATKRATSGPVPFTDLYNGPIWQQLRRQGYPTESIAVLSAEHGILAPKSVISTYDKKMTEERLDEIASDKTQVDRFAQMVEKAGKAIVFGGEDYKLFALSVLARHPNLIDKLHFSVGSYLQQRGALNHFLRAHNEIERTGKTAALDAFYDWEEEQHPRAAPGSPEGGQFALGGGGSGSSSGASYSSAGHGYSHRAVLRADTIYTSDIHDATRALYEGRKVVLDQPREAATLIDHLGQVTKHMIGMGEKAPVFNLCNVSVANTNLFCADTKGVPRIKMPQLDREQTKAFVKSLEHQGYTVTKSHEKASFLRATQNELNGAKVADIAAKLHADPDKKLRRLVVSRDNYILDGHHHWAALIGVDAANNRLGDKDMRVSRVNIGIIDLLHAANKFTGGKNRLGIGDAVIIQAAGVLFIANDGRALFLKRIEDGDPHGGEWSIAAGGLEDGEDTMHAAARESAEEVGVPGKRLELIDQRVTDGVEFFTYVERLPTEAFEPILNDEHTDYVWAPLSEPPQPLHPGLAATLADLDSSFFAYPPPELDSETAEPEAIIDVAPIQHVHRHRDVRAKSFDPTFTAGLRRAFRAASELRLRRLRALLRQAVAEYDMLGVGALRESTPSFIPFSVRLQSFSAWFESEAQLTLAGSWPYEWIGKAIASGENKALKELQSSQTFGHGELDHLYTLAQNELKGISAALSQQVTRIAAKVVMANPRPVTAFRALLRPFDPIKVRLHSFANSLTVASHVQAKLRVYGANGIGAVGITPEFRQTRSVGLLSGVSDAFNPSEERDPSGKWAGGGIGGATKAFARGQRVVHAEHGGGIVRGALISSTGRRLRVQFDRTGSKLVDPGELGLESAAPRSATNEQQQMRTALAGNFGPSKMDKDDLRGHVIENQEAQEEINSRSMSGNLPQAEADKLQRDYSALEAINYVLKNDALAHDSPLMARTSVFDYTKGGAGTVQAAIHYVIRPDNAEIKWLGSIKPRAGTALLQKAITHAKAAGVPVLKIQAKWGSAKFYERHGFVATARPDPVTDSVEMELRLRARDASDPSRTGREEPRDPYDPYPEETNPDEDLVGVLTADDDLVCQECEDYAADAPYNIDEIELPLHANCRCSVYPWFDQRFDSLHDAFVEEQHPRGVGGKWTEAGGGGQSEPALRRQLAAAERQARSIPSTEAINTPERQQLRHLIADRIYQKDIGSRAHDRQATIITGLPGVGKSKLAGPLVAKGAVEIDPDLAKEQLPEYANGIGAAAVHEESSMIIRGVLKQVLANGDSFVWPRVNSPNKVVEDIKNLQRLGYTVHLRHIEATTQVAMRSALDRFQKTGRYVPIGLIHRFADSPRQTYELGKGIADTHQLFKRTAAGIESMADSDVVPFVNTFSINYARKIRRGEHLLSDAIAEAAATVTDAALFTEEKHPRAGPGSPQGGQFVSGGGSELKPTVAAPSLPREPSRSIRGHMEEFNRLAKVARGVGVRTRALTNLRVSNPEAEQRVAALRRRIAQAKVSRQPGKSMEQAYATIGTRAAQAHQAAAQLAEQTRAQRASRRAATTPSSDPGGYQQQVQNVEQRIMQAVGVTNREHLGSGAPPAAVARGAITSSERVLYEYHRGWPSTAGVPPPAQITPRISLPIQRNLLRSGWTQAQIRTIGETWSDENIASLSPSALIARPAPPLRTAVPPPPNYPDTITLSGKKKYLPPDFNKANILLGGNLTANGPARSRFFEDYSEKIAMPPEEFKKSFMGGLPGDMRMNTEYGPGTFTINGDLKDEGGGRVATFTRRLDFDAKMGHSDYFNVIPAARGKSLGKKLLAANVAMYQKLGFIGVDVGANISVGGHAWARYGYVPDQDSWDMLRRSLRGAINRADMQSVPSEDKEMLEAAIDDDDPKEIWTIADSKYGKKLLLGTAWHGKIDFSDHQVMERFNSYVSSTTNA